MTSVDEIGLVKILIDHLLHIEGFFLPLHTKVPPLRDVFVSLIDGPLIAGVDRDDTITHIVTLTTLYG
jgi:hypothetical protein